MMVMYVIILITSVISAGTFDIGMAGAVLGLGLIKLIHISKMEMLASEEMYATRTLESLLEEMCDLELEGVEIKQLKIDGEMQ